MDFADTVSSAALWAILTEAAVTPKPGLVDRANSGSHRDMDFFTLIDSATALWPWFRGCCLAGLESESEPAALFEALRPQGKIAETRMKKASGGVNTHRGYIFSLGLLCAACGRLYRSSDKPELTAVIEFVKAMTKNLMDDFSDSNRENSHGQAIYSQSRIQGIRGEAMRGFPSVTEQALPMLKRMLKKGHSLNDAGIAALLKLMSISEDTNIIYRGGIEALHAIQKELLAFFVAEPDMKAIREKAAAMDSEFIAKNLSPGGCADLLGVALFLWRLF